MTALRWSGIAAIYAKTEHHDSQGTTSLISSAIRLQAGDAV
jgi:hypothetical protein